MEAAMGVDPSLERVDLDIKDVERQIQEVEREIKEVESMMKNEQDPVWRQYLWQKEEHLRKEKEQLRMEKEHLRKEKEQLREKELVLLKATVPHESEPSLVRMGEQMNQLVQQMHQIEWIISVSRSRSLAASNISETALGELMMEIGAKGPFVFDLPGLALGPKAIGSGLKMARDRYHIELENGLVTAFPWDPNRTEFQHRQEIKAELQKFRKKDRKWSPCDGDAALGLSQVLVSKSFGSLRLTGKSYMVLHQSSSDVTSSATFILDTKKDMFKEAQKYFRQIQAQMFLYGDSSEHPTIATVTDFAVAISVVVKMVEGTPHIYVYTSTWYELIRKAKALGYVDFTGDPEVGVGDDDGGGFPDGEGGFFPDKFHHTDIWTRGKSPPSGRQI